MDDVGVGEECFPLGIGKASIKAFLDIGISTSLVVPSVGVSLKSQVYHPKIVNKLSKSAIGATYYSAPNFICL